MDRRSIKFSAWQSRCMDSIERTGSMISRLVGNEGWHLLIDYLCTQELKARTSEFNEMGGQKKDRKGAQTKNNVENVSANKLQKR